MSLEAPNQRAIWLALGRICRLFRLNTGTAWFSSLGPRGVQRLENGSVLIAGARSIALGFADVHGKTVKGACDLPGWTSVEITPDMVGRTVAVFTSIEVKRSKGGMISDDQKNWCAQVQDAGGIAGFATSPDQATKIILDWKCQQAFVLR
jgi:hypothetical protein